MFIASTGSGRGLFASSPVVPGTDLFTTPCNAQAITSASACSNCGLEPEAGSAHTHCTGCTFLRYCGRGCQALDWPAHKHECGALRQAAAGGLTALSPTVRLVSRLLRAGAGAASAALPAPALEGPLEGLRASLEGPAGIASLATNYSLHSQEDLGSYAPLCPPILLLLQGAQPQPSPRQVLTMCAAARCSAFTLCDSEQRPFGLATFGLGALLNHSCSPTALAHFEAAPGRRLQQRLRCTAALAKGAEVTIAYCEVAAPTHLRRAELQRGYFFACACSRCAQMAATEQLLAQQPSSSSAAAVAALQLLPALPTEPAAGSSAPGSQPAAAAQAAEEQGLQGPLPAWRYLQAHSQEDLAMLSLPCTATPACPGTLLVLPSPQPVSGEGEGEGGRGEGGSGGGGGGTALLPLFGTPCSACAAPLPPRTAAALAALFPAVAALKAGRAPGSSSGSGSSSSSVVPSPTPQAHLAACLAALAQAQALGLPPRHYLLFTAAAAAAHAAVAAGAWGAGLGAGELAVEGLAHAHPPGHPVPPLHAALLGKLAHFLEQPAVAAVHFQRALLGLRRTHGKEHGLCLDIEERLASASDEAGARV